MDKCKNVNDFKVFIVWHVDCFMFWRTEAKTMKGFSFTGTNQDSGACWQSLPFVVSSVHPAGARFLLEDEMIIQNYVDCNGTGNCNNCQYDGTKHIWLTLPCGDKVDVVLNCNGAKAS